MQINYPDKNPDFMTFEISCSSGTEAALRRELEKLFPEAVKWRTGEAMPADAKYALSGFEQGRAKLHAPYQAITDLNLKLRVADRVYISLFEADAEDFDQLYDNIYAFHWEKFLTANENVVCKVKSAASKLFSLRNIQKVAHKALLDRLSKAYNLEGFIEQKGPVCEIEFALYKDRLSVSYNSSGHGLNQRGYRAEAGEAPLRETLAAAMLDFAFVKRGRKVLDCFNGSGTLAIEAVMRLRNIAPGLRRDFAFVQKSIPSLPEFNGSALMREAKSKAKTEIIKDDAILVTACDIDPAMSDLARHNAELAGVAENIEFITDDFRNLDYSEPGLILPLNPPYGERLGIRDEAYANYKALGKIYKENPYIAIFILSDDVFLEKAFGRKADKRRKLFSGSKEVTLYSYFGKKPRFENRA